MTTQLGQEMDLLANYPKAKRNLEERSQQRSEQDRLIARRFDQEFFDGDRRHGYGGYSYAPRFWQPVVPDFIGAYGLTNESSVLDVGCAKGFFLYDLKQALPGLNVAGVDVSQYAVTNSKETVRPFLQIADAVALPFADDSFDLVVSITTLHNLERDDCGTALREVERVSRGAAFVTVDAYHDEVERKRMEMWNLTARTIMRVDQWREFFREQGYGGDYFWFIP